MGDAATLITQAPAVVSAAIGAGSSLLVAVGGWLMLWRKLRREQEENAQRLTSEDSRDLFTQSRQLREELTTRHDKMVRRMDALEEKLIVLRDENDRLRLRIEALTTENEQLKERVEGLTQASEAARTESERLSRECGALYLLVEEAKIQIPDWIRRYGNRLRVE